jgi:two-component system C4-dicarboxylate transport sensor histidine kinase DctB
MASTISGARSERQSCERAGAVLRQELGDEELGVVGQHALIEQVIINLATNACDALREDFRTEKLVELSARRDAVGRIKALVSDNSPGVAPDIGDRIFEPFFTSKPVGHRPRLGDGVRRLLDGAEVTAR